MSDNDTEDFTVKVYSEQSSAQFALKLSGPVEPVRMQVGNHWARCAPHGLHLQYVDQTFPEAGTTLLKDQAVVIVTVHGVGPEGQQAQRRWQSDSLDWTGKPEWIARLVEQHRPAFMTEGDRP